MASEPQGAHSVELHSLPGEPASKREGIRRVRYWRRLTGAVLAIGICLVAGKMVLNVTVRPKSEVFSKALIAPVSRTDLAITIEREGNVESRANIDVKCRVPGGTSILWIVPDGTLVSPGDLLVRLDAAQINEQLDLQKILCAKALATRIQAEQEALAAKISLEEYEQGTYLQELQAADAEIMIAEENLRSSENLLVHTERMARKGYVTPLQRSAQTFAVQRARLDLETAQTSKGVLEKFTRLKLLTELKSLQSAAEARVKSETATFDLETSREQALEVRLASCEIRAPQRGMVIHANDGGKQSLKIEEGALVRDQQTIIRLPDLSQMQVRIAIHESKVERIQPGMPALVHIQDRELPGTVVSIANQPDPIMGWSTSSAKEYATYVKIDGEVSGLKPGMTAAVEILVAEIDDVLIVPVQAVIEQHDEYFCWVQTAEGCERHRLELGDTNDKVLEVKDGLHEGDQVVLNPLALIAEARAGDFLPTAAEESLDRFQDQQRARLQASAAAALTPSGNPGHNVATSHVP